MRILDNGTYRDMTENEIDQFMEFSDEGAYDKTDLTALAEGLSVANNMKDVQKAAKSILESED